MRVLHLVKTSDGATWALRQMRELVKLGVEVHVALPSDGPLVTQYRAADIIVHALQTSLPVRRPWYAKESLRNLRTLVDRTNPDIVHSHFVTTTLMMRLALGRHHSTPRIFQVPGPLHLEHAPYRRAELSTAGPPDHWIGSCQWTCDRYRASGVDSEHLFLSYYGTDLEHFKRHRRGKLRQELGIDDETKLVGMVAYMYAPKHYLGQTRGLKGHEDLIDAFALCLREDPNMVLVFVGGAWGGATAYEERVCRYARQRLGEHVRFLGTREDVPDLYVDLDVAVHPSHSENVGGAVESLLLAVPTIATNVGGFPDLVKTGETGWLVPPHNPEQLATTICEALRDSEHSRSLAVAGQRLARHLFDVRRTSASMVSIYESILGSTQPAEHMAGNR